MFEKDRVCHYTSKEKAISILNDKQINSSPLVSCDDPRESKQWNFDFIGSEQMFCYEHHKEALSIFDNSIKKLDVGPSNPSAKDIASFFEVNV